MTCAYYTSIVAITPRGGDGGINVTSYSLSEVVDLLTIPDMNILLIKLNNV